MVRALYLSLIVANHHVILLGISYFICVLREYPSPDIYMYNFMYTDTPCADEHYYEIIESHCHWLHGYHQILLRRTSDFLDF